MGKGRRVSWLPKKQSLNIVRKTNGCKLFRSFEGRKCTGIVQKGKTKKYKRRRIDLVGFGYVQFGLKNLKRPIKTRA